VIKLPLELDQSPIVISPFERRKDIAHHELFACLADQPWGMWLDSSESEHIDSRYDIVVWQPLIKITTNGNTSHITSANNEHSQNVDDEPLALLHKIQQQLFKDIALPQTQLPFVGGAVGFWSYDLGRRFERIPTFAKQDIATPEMAVGIYLQGLVYDRKSQQYSLFSQQSKQAYWRDYLTKSQANVQAAILPLIQPSSETTSFKLTQSWQSNMSQAEYAEKFATVQEYLLSGDCYQINLAQRFQAKYTGSEIEAYLRLREQNKGPFSAFINIGKQHILSISPERFLSLNNGNVQTKPIKGTLPRSENKEQDELNATRLQNSPKDRAENLMIVDLLRNDISRVCQPSSVQVPKLFDIESFPAVHHLVSTVEGKLSTDSNAESLLRAAFPGGSITGAPKIRAMEIIEELEPHRRSVYCGSIGYISANGNMDTSITIRTLVCDNNNIYCWAGGGLVADSKVDSEYQETFDKVAKILPVLSSS